MSQQDEYNKGFDSGSSEFGGAPKNANENAGYLAGQQQRAALDRLRTGSGPSEPLFSLKVWLCLILIGGGGALLLSTSLIRSPFGLSIVASAALLLTFFLRRPLGRLGPVLIGALFGLALGLFRLTAADGVVSIENLWFSTSLGLASGLAWSVLRRE